VQILENLISAFSVLRGSKLRTVLTLLGITIGIAGVIAMMSFGAGAKSGKSSLRDKTPSGKKS
jgi:putative ABC transport system permease protein